MPYPAPPRTQTPDSSAAGIGSGGRTSPGLVVCAWLVTRVIAVISVDLTPWILRDIDRYGAWLGPLRNGAFPAMDDTWQYPPGAGPVFLAAGATGQDLQWTFIALMLACDAAIMGALLITRRRVPGTQDMGLWVWALAGVVVGPIMLTRFDLVPTLLAVLAVLLARRPITSGAVSALGFIVKVWPALMLIVVPRRKALPALAAFAVTTAAALALLALTFTESLSFLSNQHSRGLQVESLGAIPWLISRAAGHPVRIELTYGSMQVMMPGAQTVGTILTLIGLVLILALFYLRIRGRLEQAEPGDLALTVILVSLVTSRVNSPQFTVWLVGIAATAALASRSRLRAVVLLVLAASILTQVVYPWSGTQLTEGGLSAVIPQLARMACLLVATTIAVIRIWPRGRSGSDTGVGGPDDSRVAGTGS